ncbi:hypothetical protein FB451DRAFT_1371046 [Mycena latifolia]|nr:hypothetical protein FB451DRAFT_1371046 [Mycena latifolia]
MSRRRRLTTSEFTGFPRGVGSVGNRESHPGHGFDALPVGVCAGKGLCRERPLWTFGERCDPIRTSLPWCHGAFVRTFGPGGWSFGPSERSHGALRIVEGSNGLVETSSISGKQEAQSGYSFVPKSRGVARIDPDGTPKDKETGEPIKRVNFIVITDGEATDNPKYPIIDAASQFKSITNLCTIQLGIQFVQIGNDSRATNALKELDDDLHKTRNIRDIVDTTPYSKLNPVTADGLIKVLLGGINRRIDEQKN